MQSELCTHKCCLSCFQCLIIRQLFLYRCTCMHCSIFTWWKQVGSRTEYRRIRGVWPHIKSSSLHSQRSSDMHRGEVACVTPKLMCISMLVSIHDTHSVHSLEYFNTVCLKYHTKLCYYLSNFYDIVGTFPSNLTCLLWGWQDVCKWVSEWTAKTLERFVIITIALT